MYRQSPSRSQRSNRIKVKHILQFSLLLGVGCWLLYQLKRSHDNNIQLETTESKVIMEGLNGIELPKLGRKGIQDIFEETLSKNVKHMENEEETGDEEESKIEKGESKSQALVKTEDEGEVDELEENDQEGTDAEYEELPGDERDKEVDDENEAVEDDANEAAHEKTGAGNSVEETDREARETQYKADDASSAVAHESQTRSLENAEEHSEQHNISLEVAKNDTRKELDVVVDELNGEDKLNVTKPSAEGVIEDSARGSPPNSTTEGSSEIATENQNASLNSTINEDDAEAVFQGIKSGDGSILSTVTSNQSNSSNSTDSADKTMDAPNETASEDMARIEASDGVKVDFIDGSNDKVDSTSNEELQEILREAVDALPDTQNNEAEDDEAE